MEAVCHIQRSTDIVAVDEALRYSLIMMVVDASREVDFADAVRAIWINHGIDKGSFSIVPFFPEQFVIHCRSQETHDRIMAASVVPAMGTFLVLQPWTRLAPMNTATMHCKVSLELEGILTHAWSEDTISKILAP